MAARIDRGAFRAAVSARLARVFAAALHTAMRDGQVAQLVRATA
jgi:hypothetical protein